EAWIRIVSQALEYREVSDRSQHTAGEHHGLAADAIRERTPHHEAGCTDEESGGDDEIGSLRVQLQDLLQEEQLIELTAVPDDRLACRGTYQSQNHDPQVGPAGERFDQRCFRQLTLALELEKRR